MVEEKSHNYPARRLFCKAPALGGVFMIVALLVTGCVSSRIIWTGHHSFPATKWVLETPVVFIPDTLSIRDTTAMAHRGILSIRYSSGASVENLPIVMEIESAHDGSYSCDTLRQRLLPKAERTAQKGRMGIFETIDTIKLPSNFAPGWSATFYPALEEDVEGIISLTLDIIKDEK